MFRATPQGDLGAGGLVAPLASRNVAAGSFVVHAVDAKGAPVATETSSFDYLIVG